MVFAEFSLRITVTLYVSNVAGHLSNIATKEV